MRFTPDDRVALDIQDPEAEAPRANFDSFYMGLTSVFIIFIGEDWQMLLYSHYRVHGFTAMIFFPLMFIMLNLIMLNLFLVILL